MRAVIRKIEPNNHDLSWETFVEGHRANPVTDDFGEFTLLIGPEGEDGTNIFSVRVSTPAAASHARKGRYFKGIIVDSFEPDLIRKAIEDYVASIERDTWQGIVDQLRFKMDWEYDGMTPVKQER